MIAEESELFERGETIGNSHIRVLHHPHHVHLCQVFLEVPETQGKKIDYFLAEIQIL